MSTHNLCFEHKYEKYQNFLSENFHFLVVKFSIYLNRRVFIMTCMASERFRFQKREWVFLSKRNTLLNAYSKAVPLLQFLFLSVSVCGFILRVCVVLIWSSSLLFLGWAVLRDCGISKVSSLMFFFLWKQNVTAHFVEMESNTIWILRLKLDIIITWMVNRLIYFNHYENTPIQIYWKFTTQNWKFSQKNSDIFHISAQNIDWGYSLEQPCRGGSNECPQPSRQGDSNEYPQSMFLNRNKKNNVYSYLCKPQFYYIKVGFKGCKII